MLKRDRTQLAVYSIEEEIETLPLMRLRNLYLDKTSEIIYITKDNKLYGIICMGEALCPDQKGLVRINKCFTSLLGSNVIKAREIFKEKKKIHKIPVINESGELISDYSRWDDALYVKRNHKLLMHKDMAARVLGSYETVYLVKPVDEKDCDYLCLLDTLKNFQICYTILHKEQIIDKLTEKAVCIFLNEDERRGVQCLYGLTPRYDDGRGCSEFRYDQLADERWKLRMATYRSLLLQIKYEMQIDRLGIKWTGDLTYEELNDRASFLLTGLQKEGIKCFYFNEIEDVITEYGNKFMNAIQQRLNTNQLSQDDLLWTEGEAEKRFYGELYQQEDYKRGVVRKEIYDALCEFECRKDVSGKYFNAKEGKRITCFQPDTYRGTIYLLGPCVMVGIYVEDQYTIASYLQKKLLEEGYIYKVENYGAISHADAKIEEISQLNDNDIVIYISRTGKVVDIQGSSLEKIFDKYQISYECVTDSYIHCNHSANQKIADTMAEMVIPYLMDRGIENENTKIWVSPRKVIEKYIACKYLNLYFWNFHGSSYDTIGAIVMNCNPFSKGHRYLIEQARQKVEFLIIFVVEENASLFSFEERFQIIEDAVKDIDGVMVVPSGDFILSKNNFYEYFSKQESKAVTISAEYDIYVFANYIAPPLHITHRFAGEEPEDKTTRLYNEAMKKILPQKGILFEEIPRMKTDDGIISASKVRNYLKNRRYDKAFKLLPETTQKYIKKQL